MFALFLAGWLSATTSISLTGEAAYYSPGLMDRVAETRGMDLDGYEGGVALMSCGDLGREVWLELPEWGIVGPFLSVDCSQEAHYAYNLARDRVIDVAGEVWLAYDLPSRPVPVVVWFVVAWLPDPLPRRRWRQPR